MDLINREKNLKSHAKSNLINSTDFTFYKYQNIKVFTKHSYYLKINNLIQFKCMLELFYDNTEEINPNNEEQENDFGKRKIVINTASELYGNLDNQWNLNIGSSQVNS